MRFNNDFNINAIHKNEKKKRALFKDLKELDLTKKSFFFF